MHAEIARTDQILRDGLYTLRAYLLNQGSSVRADVPPRRPVQDLERSSQDLGVVFQLIG